MPEFDDELDYAWWSETKRPSKAAERKGWRSSIQEELDDLGDLYELPESIRHRDIPGVRL
ncbi:hypothetical protein [Streptomyces sp. NPDC006355]|uniref:hypothetical protein n=1 Tax=Streptomyces sp. NPDC006355 TaxID=3156758 RepID=UPI0033B7C03B